MLYKRTVAEMFTKTELSQVIQIDCIITLHYFEYTKEFQFKGESHDFWEMVYVDFGEVYVLADDIEYILKQGEAYFHKPNEYHSIWSNNTYSGVTIITFESHSEAMSYFNNKLLVLNDNQKQHIAKILEEGTKTFQEPFNIVDQDKLILSPDAPFGSEQLIKTNIEQMLIDMVRCDKAISKKTQVSRSHVKNENLIVEKISDILHDNLCGQISLDLISSQIGYSKSYAKTLFKNATGMSIIQMFLKMKIDYAKKLISEQKYSVTEISEILGFNSVHYFSRVFKKVTGIPPSDYSNSVRHRALL